ncbi:glycoside hydrolase family 95 protein [Bacteroides congonensis]|uniref:glycoside hydrolase family 95 protein n=1 Tax=Bacteroides congonensis TaxID=1871006 RepID=UPI000AF9585D|nr:glycoside hydrolase family 95 protein [Bacteroides congonensis]
MKINNAKKSLRLFGLLLLLVLPGLQTMFAGQPPMKLWYDKPATVWMTSALPIGNGELGGMFFGGVAKEQMQFNEKTLWTGSTAKRGAYQNFGDLFLEFPEQPSTYTEYKRELSLDNALGSVSYRQNGIHYHREYFASYPDSVIVMRITTPGKKGKLSFSVRLADAHPGVTKAGGNKITISGTLDLLSYEAQAGVWNEGGTLAVEGTEIKVSDADAVTILLSAATNYSIHSSSYLGESKEQLHRRVSRRIAQAGEKEYKELKQVHLADYCPKFNRVKLDLGGKMPDIPTDLLVSEHKESVYLDMLYFQYGRYLMLGSSRGMSLPNNLQGIWNNDNRPAWQCDIHTNINIQMNYWPAENTNLLECHHPFLDYIATEARKKDGSWQKVARKENLRGWSMKTQSNIFAFTDWNINRPVNAWFCMHLWQHFAYSADTVYLKETAFPVMQAACEYWFDRLKKDDKTGKWIAPAEWSPEQGPWEDGVTYAQQLVRELFDQTLKAAEIVGSDSSFKRELKDKYENLDYGLVIGDWGQIREWKNHADIKGDDHRHLSHLMALYPGNHISYHLDKTYADAAKTSLESRGDQGTGWSRAWKIACWARLFDGEHAYRLLKSALSLSTLTVVSMDNSKGGVYENLLDSHPPFQIDGNFGATAGIAEMLLQSNLGFIQLVPALPEAWSCGEFTGLKAVGNFTVSLLWKSGKPAKCRVYSGSGNECKVYCPAGMRITAVKDKSGRKIDFTSTGELVAFSTQKGEEYKLIIASK